MNDQPTAEQFQALLDEIAAKDRKIRELRVEINRLSEYEWMYEDLCE